MKRIFLFNWEITQTNFIQGMYIEIFTHTKVKYRASEYGYSANDVYTTFLVEPENIIDDKETVLIPH